MAKKARADEGPGYGEAAERLEEILGKIEEGQVEIDELSELVREAAGLVNTCREKIRAAEIQVKSITEQLERESPAPAEDDSGE